MKQRFNLLPHQAMRRQWAIRVLLRQMLAIGLLAISIALLNAQIQSYRIEFAESYNKALAEAVLVQVPGYQRGQTLLAQRASLLEKKAVLEKVDARRTSSVLLMNDLVEARPEGLYFTRVEENGEAFRIEGRAMGSDAVARFYEHLGASRQLRDLVLEEIQVIEQDAGRLYGFVMHGHVSLAGANATFAEAAE